MNPYLIIAALLAMAGASLGSFQLGVDHQKASQIDKEQTVAEAVKAANDASAQVLATMKPTYTTIKSEVRREIQTNTVFADCKLPADSLRLVNQALNAGRRTEPAGGGKLPDPDPTE